MSNQTFVLIMLIILALSPAILIAQVEPQLPINYHDDNAGTEGNPFQISSLANLRWLSETQEFYATVPNRQTYTYFIQTEDIDASETIGWNDGNGFNPIGLFNLGGNTPGGEDPITFRNFFGSYDGQNHKISNLHIHRDYSMYDFGEHVIGLFGYVSESDISNVNLENINYSINIGMTQQPFHVIIGGLVGLTTGSTFKGNNCSATGRITINSIEGDYYANLKTGGLVGWMSNSILSESSSRIDIFDNVVVDNYTNCLGGLVGYLHSSELSNSYFYGNIFKLQEIGNYYGEGGVQRGGGLVGELRYSYIENCYVSSREDFFHTNGLFGDVYCTVVPSVPQTYVTNVFWDMPKTATTMAYSNLFGENYFLNFYGRTTEMMKEVSTYYGWDFINIWEISPDVNDGYPYLRANALLNHTVSEIDNTAVPNVFKLNSNYPNPFNPSTTIAFDMATAGHVSIDIYNVKGQRVKTLVNDHKDSGTHHVVWDGTDASNCSVGSGVYFVRMTKNEFSSTRRMVLMK